MHPLLEAVVTGNLDEVKRQIEVLDVPMDKTRAESGATALILAIVHNQYAVAKYLLDKGASIEALDEKGCNAIHIAAEMAMTGENMMLLELLLQYDMFRPKPSIDNCDFHGNTPLHIVTKANKFEPARLLIQAGANIYAKDYENKEPYEIGVRSTNAAVQVLFHSAHQWQAVFNNLNLFKIMNILDKGLSNILEIAAREVFLVMGISGAGKSTLINYLLGVDFRPIPLLDERGIQRVNKRGVPLYKSAATHLLAEPIGETKAKIGNTAMSETLYPAAYDDALHTLDSLPLTYVDLAGFDDNRGPAIKLAVAMGTRLAVQAAAKIKGIVVVIESATISAGRGKDLANLSKTLADIFKVNKTTLADSVFFVVTKAQDAYGNESLKKDIDNQLSLYRNKLKEFTDSKYITPSPGELTKADVEHIISILELMQANKDNSIIVDILDDESKHKIISRLATARPIAKSEVSFNAFDTKQVEFNDGIFKLSGIAGPMLARFNDLPFEIKTAEDEQESLEKSLNFYSKQAAQLGKIITDLKQKEHKIKELEEQITVNKNSVAAVNAQISAHQEKIRQLDDDIRTLNTDELVTLWKSSVYEERHLLGHFFSWTEANFVYPGGVKGFESEVKLSKRNSGDIFKTVTCKPAEGKCEVYYESERGETGSATVELVIKKRLKPENAKTILDKSSEKADLVKKISALQNKNTPLLAEIERLSASIKNIHESRPESPAVIEANRKEYDSKLIEFRTNLKSCKDHIQELKAEKERLSLEITVGQTFFNALNKLLSLVKYDHPLTNAFQREYARSENTDASVLMVRQPSAYDCPVSYEIMRDPVSLPCDHRFDRQSIVTWAESKIAVGHTVSCPCCRAPFNHLTNLRPERALKAEIDQWLSDHDPYHRLTNKSAKELHIDIKRVTAELAATEMQRQGLQGILDTMPASAGAGATCAEDQEMREDIERLTIKIECGRSRLNMLVRRHQESLRVESIRAIDAASGAATGAGHVAAVLAPTANPGATVTLKTETTARL